jgi:hypothetical protein
MPAMDKNLDIRGVILRNESKLKSLRREGTNDGEIQRHTTKANR